MPSVRSSSWRALVMRNAPVPPSGWPRAMAPPFGLVRSGSAPTSRCQASTTEAKASLISNRSMSSIAMPVRSSRRCVASIGPVSMSTGSTPTRHVSTTRARGVRPRAAAFSAVIISTAAAAVADLRRGAGRVHAVGAGHRLEVGRAPRGWSRAGPRRARPGGSCPWACPSSSRSGASTATTWPSKRPSAHAVAARCWEARPNASVSARVMPHLSAMRSAPSNWDVNS